MEKIQKLSKTLGNLNPLSFILRSTRKKDKTKWLELPYKNSTVCRPNEGKKMKQKTALISKESHLLQCLQVQGKINRICATQETMGLIIESYLLSGFFSREYIFGYFWTGAKST